MDKVYACIDLKTFYASVECIERGLDPMYAHVAVADASKGKGTICLAISTGLKQKGVKNRCRLYEIPSYLTYIIAKPRMRLYMEYAANIYSIYLRYVSKEDIYVYSIDEAFLDLTNYLSYYQMDAQQLVKKILYDIQKEIGIYASAGIGTNLYLAKVALDILAKHAKDGIAYMNEDKYRQQLWHHKPLQDFWQVGKGIVERLKKYGIFDMYGIAHCKQDLLYQEFGVNAEYLIDHAWGIEPTTIQDIQQYEPKQQSLSSHQILQSDYTYEEAKLVLKEMVELHTLRLVNQHLVTGKLHLFIGYTDRKQKLSKSWKLHVKTNACSILMKEFLRVYEQCVHKSSWIRSIGITFEHVEDEKYESFDLFSDPIALEKERKLQHTLVNIKQKYGKSSILKGMNMLDKATTLQRNRLIGGHNAE